MQNHLEEKIINELAIQTQLKKCMKKKKDILAEQHKIREEIKQKSINVSLIVYLFDDSNRFNSKSKVS